MSSRRVRAWLPALALAGAGLGAPVPGVAGEWFPERLVHEPYLASPRTVHMRIGVISVDQSDIPGVGDARSDVRLGQHFGLYRWDNGWHASGFAGFNGLFDLDRDTDNIGWDGRYGITLAREWRPGRTLKLGSRHQSAHIGDELIESTGRKRINYTREEFNVGYSHALRSPARVYLETGWGWDLRNEDVQDPWRLQAGYEYRAGLNRLDGDGPRWRPFVALDLESMEERDWELDATLQAGWLLRQHGQLWRAAVEFRHGRVPLGEFSGSEEDYLGASLSLFRR